LRCDLNCIAGRDVDIRSLDRHVSLPLFLDTTITAFPFKVYDLAMLRGKETCLRGGPLGAASDRLAPEQRGGINCPH
jgi:hypothetical protein